MKLIDSEKLYDWLYSNGHHEICEEIRLYEGAGTFDPTPVQPDIKPGDKVKHKDYKHYGIGIVDEVAKSGLRAHCHFPDYDQRRSNWEPRGYYRLDKLEVIK